MLERWGLLPLSSFIPDHPSLESLTRHEAWHTGNITDPWLWRDRFAAEGIAAYGRFIAGKPLLISREMFPLVKCLLSPPKTVKERYQAGLLARSTMQIYELICEHDGIDVRALRKQAGMQEKSAKAEFDHALIDLQSSADIVISGISERLNAQGNKNGWNSTCYMLAERWMAQSEIEPLALSQAEAKGMFFTRLEQHWNTNAIIYMQKRIG